LVSILLLTPRPQRFTRFPYTTLFRSKWVSLRLLKYVSHYLSKPSSVQQLFYQPNHRLDKSRLGRRRKYGAPFLPPVNKDPQVRGLLLSQSLASICHILFIFIILVHPDRNIL